MLISDVHANFPALKAVFKDLSHYFGPVDYILCAGDLVGVGPFPNEVCNSLKRLKNFISVKGECDQAAIDGKFKGIEPAIAESIRWTTKNLTEENMNFLSSLEDYAALKISGFRIFLVHGSPDNHLNGVIRGVEPSETLKKYLEETEADMIVCGQTHVPFIKEINGKYIINPGSVGEPRDGNPAASYVFVDIDNMEINFRRVSYNVEEITQMAKRLLFPEDILDRFYFGR